MGSQIRVNPEWRKTQYGMFLDLNAPYHASAEFTTDMKAAVPGDERLWDKARRQWWISDCYLDEVDQLLSRHFGKKGYRNE